MTVTLSFFLLFLGILFTAHGLEFNAAVPSTTLNQQQLTSLIIFFTPGVPMVAGDTITLTPSADQAGFLQAAKVFNAVTSNTGIPAMGNCTASTATTSATTAAGLAVFAATLGPQGCLLPIGFRQALTVPQSFLVLNGNNVDVLFTLATSKEPTSLLLYAYATGASTVARFVSAVPSTTLAGAVPTSLALSFVTRTALLPNLNQQFVLLPNPTQVFTPQMLTPLTATTSVLNCSGMQAFTFILGQGTGIFVAIPNSTYCPGGIPAGTTVVVTVTSGLLANPFPVGTAVAWSVATSTDLAMLQYQPGYTTSGGCGTSNQPQYTPGNVNDIATMPAADLNALATSVDNLAGVQGGLQCLVTPIGMNTSAFVTYWNVPFATYQSGNVSLQGTPPIAITNWGIMYTVPMLAVVVSYPLTSASLTSLGIFSVNTEIYDLAFILKVDRIDTARLVRNDNSPFQFAVNAPNGLDFVMAYRQPNSAGQTVSEQYGAVQCDKDACLISTTYTATFVGLVHHGGGSSLGLLGLLGLIAIPVGLCCCAAVFWFLRRRNSAPAYNAQWVPRYPGPGPMGPMGPAPWGMPPMGGGPQPIPMPMPYSLGPMGTPSNMLGGSFSSIPFY